MVKLMSGTVVLDLETKKSFREITSSKPADLGVSLVGLYSYDTDHYQAFREEELERLFPLLEKASLIIGFNLDSFDMPALQPYYLGNIGKMATLDILSEVKKVLGRRLALNDLASATLGTKKSGHGLMAIDYYREGNFAALEKYCLDDVRITKELFDFGRKNGEVFYLDVAGKQPIKVNWQDLAKNKKAQVNLTLPL